MSGTCWQTGLKMELCNSPFLYVLRAGLWGTLDSGPDSALLSDIDWAVLLRQAHAHAVDALIADGMGLLPFESKPLFQELGSLALAVDAIESGNKLLNAVLKSMAAYWEKVGIKAVLLKGQGLASMYSNPLHRTPGDIDWYFPGKENFNKALALIRAKGLVPEIDGDGDFHYSVKGVIVEHHNRWCDISSPFKKKSIASIEQKFGYSRGPEYTVPAPLTNLIQLNFHILKHVLVMGVGWRQLCDLALATERYWGQYSIDEYKQAVSQLSLLKWSRLLYGVLAKYLGSNCAWMPVTPLENRDVDRLANLIMDCGNFGKESGKKMLGSYASSALWLCRYAPGEVFWRPIMLALIRLGQFIRRK